MGSVDGIMPHMAGMVTGAGRRSVILAVALLLAACSGTSSAAAPTTTTSPPTTTVTTTTTSPPTTTTEPSTTTTTTDPLARPDVLVSNPNRSSVDDFDTTGDDLYRVVMELRDLFVYLEGHPTGTAEEMVSLMYQPSHPSYNLVLAGFRELTDNSGWHYVDPGVETLGVELVAVSGNTAVFAVADRRDEQRIADATGSVVRTYEGWDGRVTTITYERGTEGRWRYADLEPSRPLSDAELETMVRVEWVGRTP